VKERHGIDRREFFRLAGGGIVVLVGMGPLTAFAQGSGFIYPEDFNAYLVIGDSGKVTVFSGKIEMGQGVMTSQAQMAAEELGVSLDAIDMVLGDTDRCPADLGTFGSLTTRMFGPALRAAAAQARLTLVALAGRRLGVDADKLLVKDGVVSVAGDPTRSVSYGQLSRGARIAQSVDARAVLRGVREFQVIGTSPRRLDGLEKVTGGAKYAADIRVAGMLYARVLRPPVHGAVLLKLDTTGAEAMPGVTVVNRDGLVAVMHADPEAADAAMGRVKVDWSTCEASTDPDSIFDRLQKLAAPLKNMSGQGDVDAARPRAAHLFEATYFKGYVAHAPIEPHAALADIKAGKATIWASTQTPWSSGPR